MAHGKFGERAWKDGIYFEVAFGQKPAVYTDLGRSLMRATLASVGPCRVAGTLTIDPDRPLEREPSLGMIATHEEIFLRSISEIHRLQLLGSRTILS